MKTRRYLRFAAYLPVQCTLLRGEHPMATVMGKTKSLSPGGLGLLLPETISLRTPVLVQLLEEEPLPGVVIWRDSPIPTDLTTRVPHGVAFDERVAENRLQRWLLNARQQAHPRVRVQFHVQFSEAGGVRHGTCLNLSRGGMFITTMDDLPPPGTATSLRFKPHDSSHTMLIPAEVAWRGQASGPSGITGMGAKFLEVNAEEAASIDSVVDLLLEEASPSPPPS